jgi:EmrB/QacA subfamily drug resistance transporter
VADATDGWEGQTGSGPTGRDQADGSPAGSSSTDSGPAGWYPAGREQVGSGPAEPGSPGSGSPGSGSPGSGSPGSGSPGSGSPVAGSPGTGQAGGGQAGAAQFLAPREVFIVLPGLLLAILLAMLDNLIVSTALQRIVGELGGVAHLSWVVTAYILASTITTPFYGKLGDMYGRKKFFVTAIVIFLVGSALSGLSQSMAELIAFRALQGLGAGGLMVSAMAVLGDIVAPRERGRYMGYMMVVMMLATVGGPLLGGFITTSFSWRWIFYINLPVGGAALVYLLATLHMPAKKVSHKVDYLGGVLLAVATTALILLATWGGTQYAWASAQIIGLGLLGVVAGAAFCVVETKAAEPMLPLHVFRNRNFSLAMVLTFLTGLAMFGAMTFLPLYQQTVQGASPTVSGLLLTPMMVGSTVTSMLAGQVVTKTGRYKLFPVLGGALMAVAMILLTRLGVGTTRTTTGLYYVVLGMGLGFLMQMVSLISQNSVQQRDMGVASSARMFFQQIGGSLGVAAFGAVFASHLTSSLRSVAGPGVHIGAGSGQLDPATVNQLPAPVRHDVFYAIAHAVQVVFVWAAPSAVLIFVLALLIKEVPLRARTSPSGPQGAGETAGQQPELVS